MSTVALDRLRWRHPEWVAATAAVAGWLLLAMPQGADVTGHAHHLGAPAAQAPRFAGIVGWLVMSIAMMVPSALPAARRLALTGMWRRRQRTVALFLGSYLVVWAAFGIVVVPTAGLIGIGTPVLVAGALVVAAVWELTGWKRRSLRACALVRPLPPHGRKADVACVRAGFRYGQQCVVGCWALMLVMAVAGHGNLVLMALLTAIVVAEKIMVKGTRLGKPVAVVLLGVAVLVLLS